MEDEGETCTVCNNEDGAPKSKALPQANVMDEQKVDLAPKEPAHQNCPGCSGIQREGETCTVCNNEEGAQDGGRSCDLCHGSGCVKDGRREWERVLQTQYKLRPKHTDALLTHDEYDDVRINVRSWIYLTSEDCDKLGVKGGFRTKFCFYLNDIAKKLYKLGDTRLWKQFRHAAVSIKD